MNLPDQALWHLFADGVRVVRNDMEAFVDPHTLDIGHLTLPTGRIVVSDPFLDPWNEPFSVRVPPESYPVFLSVIHGDVAAVMVSFRPEPPELWHAADPPAFGVDSATGCLMDQKVCKFLRHKAMADKYERYANRFRDELDSADGMWANCCLDEESRANIVLFHTWGGDGHFPAFFGFAGDGRVCCLVIDMYLALECVVAVQLPG